jgi:hypothetical protein
MGTATPTFIQHVTSLWQERLGLQDVVVEWEFSENPNGMDDCIAHTHADPDLTTFTVEYNFTDISDSEAEVTMVHELLHVALRHLGGIAARLCESADPAHRTLGGFVEQGLEEDTERLALALVAKWS